MACNLGVENVIEVIRKGIGRLREEKLQIKNIVLPLMVICGVSLMA